MSYTHNLWLVVVQLLSRVWLIATPWTAACQAPLLHCLLESAQIHVHWVTDVIQPSHPLLPPSPFAFNPSQYQSFPVSQLFAWGGQSTGVSALASFLPKKSQGWSPSEWTGWISLQFKGLYAHIYMGASLVAQIIKNLPAMQETCEDPWRRECLLTPGFLA